MPDQESTTPWARETPGRIAVQYGRFARIANKITVECVVTKGSAVVSSQTSQAEVQSLIDRAVKLGDPKLAADIRQFASTRQYGLVFEHNRPERMRLYGKPVTARDVVQVLPRRGTAESAENRLLWRISALHDGKADLYAYVAPDYADNDGEPRTVDVSDLVAVSEYDQPIYAGLRETGRVEHGGDKPYQVVINGENYHALEALAFACAGKVDCIYIDPPYNTGAKNWKYNNDYVDGSDQYRHSKWLAFMERRLKLAKRLLNPADSVLIVTIDEKEYTRLGLLLDSVFPDANIQMVTSVISKKGSNRRNEFSRCAEFIYYVMLGAAAPISTPSDMNGTGKTATTELPVCWQYLKRRGSSLGASRKGRPGLFYPIFINRSDGSLHSIGSPLPGEVDRHDVICPSGTWAAWPLRPNGEEGCWQVQPSRLQEQLEEGTCYLSATDESKEAAQFLYLKDNDRKKVLTGQVYILGKESSGKLIIAPQESLNEVRPKDVWTMNSHDATHGTNMINSLLINRRFPYPKSLYAVEDTIRFFVADKPDALVVDFFSGSGTTAHAVMRLNHQDGGRRRSISVTNNEVGVEEAKTLIKAGHRQGDSEWEARGICEYITKPRITAAITGRTPDGEPVKGSYSITKESFELDEDAQAISKKTGKPIKRNYYVKKQVPDPSVRDQFPMADGFEENAVFYDLTYQDPTAVRLGMAFREVAPLLWLRAGARGRCIEEEKPDWDIADTYAVLFDPSRANAFVSELAKAPHVGLVYVVTDDERRSASVSAMLGGLPAVRLYADYLRSFRISAEGANN